MAASYTIDVETGARMGAGRDGKITITLAGTLGTVGPFKLSKRFHKDFHQGKTDEFKVGGNDVGDLLLITLKNCSGSCLSRKWFINRVIITKTPNTQHEVYNFPCFRWVIKDLVVFEGKALLPCSPQNNVLQKQRKEEVKNNQKLYTWSCDPTYSQDLPGSIKAKSPSKLPKDVQFTSSDSYSLFQAGKNGFLNIGLGALFNRFESWDSFDDFRQCFIPAVMGPFPPAAQQWQDDVWYGSQFLNGCNPDVITRCTALPAKFPVTDEIVANRLDRGVTLQQAMEAGNIYMVDYEILDGIPTFDKGNDVRHIAPAMGLFFVQNSGDLVPIAIQLHQVPGEGNPIWSPNDNNYDWISAKLWLRAADTQYHQMLSHLLRCHLMMEPIAVSAWRQLPSLHPVWKILYPHIKGVMAINTLGRERLISPGGITDQVLSIGGGGHILLMQKYYRNITWGSYDLPQRLKERGVHDPEKLPKFYYRDDALALWNAIGNFLKEVLYIYYLTDDDVVKDNELQNWAGDLHDNGYTATSTASVDKECPSSFKKREELIHFLTMAIFTSSCQHAAVNFSQKDVYGFHPNSPSLMRQPAAFKKGEATLANTLNTLATKHQSSLMVFIVNELVTVYPDEKFLGDYDEFLFTDPAAIKAIANLEVELKGITDRINDRNSKLEVPYCYLLPTRIPNSIAI